MNRFFLLLATGLMIIAAPVALADSGKLILADHGQTKYVIVPAGDAIPSEYTAAKQLQKYLEQVTGATFPIRSATKVRADAPQILVGAGWRVRSLLPNQNWAALGHGGIVIKTLGNRLILAGGRPRGALYAVFQFLENTVGCRWWTPTARSIPHRGTLRISVQDVVYVPAFSYRESYNRIIRNHPIFATILHENGNFTTQSETWGGHTAILGWVHTFFKFLPPKKYFKNIRSGTRIPHAAIRLAPQIR